MSSRDRILSAIENSGAPPVALPELAGFKGASASVEQFIETLTSIGGQVTEVSSLAELESTVARGNFSRVVTNIPELSFAAHIQPDTNPHTLQDVSLAILPGVFGVAENGALWISEKQMGARALPFICEHLALVISKRKIVATMHEAYQHLEEMNYTFGTFLAGPSKTADIEQSLVLGAHGSRTLRVFLLP